MADVAMQVRDVRLELKELIPGQVAQFSRHASVFRTRFITVVFTSGRSSQRARSRASESRARGDDLVGFQDEAEDLLDHCRAERPRRGTRAICGLGVHIIPSAFARGQAVIR